ncbi:sensor histidine kinase [Anaerolentibacter hominis]|uniref:sensor histidine kinase n=1 Tax=Anaerolentibacter hominis TaxID=3079009 RepID=UPI0031B892E4
MDIFWFLWYAIISSVETISCSYLFTRRIGRHKNRFMPVIGAIILFAAFLLMHTFYVSDMTAALVRFVLYIGYAYLAFGNGWVTRIVWGCIPGLISAAAQTLAYGIASTFNYGDLAGAWLPGSVHFYVTATAAMLQIIIVLAAANAGNPAAGSLTILQLFFLMGMSGVCIAAIHMQMRVVYTLTGFVGTQNTQKSAVFVSICFLILLAALAGLINSLGKESRKAMEKSLELQQVQMESDYYRNLEASVKALRELRHDMQTHMHVMRGLLEIGDDVKLKEYFNSVEERFRADNIVFATDNTMLNAMLTSKQMTAGEYRINMTFSYATQRSIPLAPLDLCSLIGNLIDNGIEACRKVMDDDARYIDLFVGEKGDMVYIKMKNSSNGIYNWDDGELRTTKTGGRHGIGLKRIRKIAESAGGFFDVNPRPDEFTAVVMLPSAGGGQGYAKNCSD